jgi:hypothetical protein
MVKMSGRQGFREDGMRIVSVGFIVNLHSCQNENDRGTC